ncbi:MAG TPA: glycosyltransferase family protein [Caulobacteraceae bacterium]|nr:glycosyltransferase family protein [Caulobacteraceae bacterium]
MVLTVLQARMSSTRLPGKVMRPLCGEPMIGRQVERLRRARSLGPIVVATSTGADDDAVAAYARTLGLPVFRGALADVLDRFHGAAAAHGGGQHLVRLTADCPLADPEVIDAVVARHLESGADYTSNTVGSTYPKGLDVEVCRLTALEAAWREAVDPYEREHVTPFVYRRPERFRLESVSRDPPLHYRWTVDTPEDFAFVEAVYAALYPADPAFTSRDVLDWQARHPDRVIPNPA